MAGHRTPDSAGLDEMPDAVADHTPQGKRMGTKEKTASPDATRTPAGAGAKSSKSAAPARRTAKTPARGTAKTPARAKMPARGKGKAPAQDRRTRSRSPAARRARS